MRNTDFLLVLILGFCNWFHSNQLIMQWRILLQFFFN